ncbi:MAG: alpha/beta fold hydrolase, partial [Deltaproteobacteria bacterium]|nr:alpha/beta fold hydrolase [Deltaproteobacteria bacterium]
MRARYDLFSWFSWTWTWTWTDAGGPGPGPGPGPGAPRQSAMACFDPDAAKKLIAPMRAEMCTSSRSSPAALLAMLCALGPAGCLSFHQGPMRYPGEPFAFVDVDGLKVHYRELKPAAPVGPAGAAAADLPVAGAGASPETIVFLHGYGGALISWFYCQPVLATRFRTVALDLKGFGLTDKPPGDYSIEAQAELVREVMDRLQIPRAHLVAHSWGGSVALTLALRHPQRVGKLVVVSGFVYEEQLNSFMRW